MIYESPIKLTNTMESIAKRVSEEGEKNIYECIAYYGIDVNKEELEKALRYDREQYEKGYANGRADAEMQLLELENMDEVVRELNVLLLKNKLTIKGMAGEKLIIIDQTTGEEYIVEDLGYPF